MGGLTSGNLPALKRELPDERFVSYSPGGDLRRRIAVHERGRRKNDFRCGARAQAARDLVEEGNGRKSGEARLFPTVPKRKRENGADFLERCRLNDRP